MDGVSRVRKESVTDEKFIKSSRIEPYNIQRTLNSFSFGTKRRRCGGDDADDDGAIAIAVDVVDGVDNDNDTNDRADSFVLC